MYQHLNLDDLGKDPVAQTLVCGLEIEGIKVGGWRSVLGVEETLGQRAPQTEVCAA